MALKITLTRGLSGCKKNQIATIKALGLKKIRSSVIKQNNDAIDGMIRTVSHLVEVEEVCEEEQS